MERPSRSNTARLLWLAGTAGAVLAGIGWPGPRTALAAAAPGWTSIGPVGGAVWSASWCGADTQVAYAGTDLAGVFRSSDAGLHWTPARAGLPAGTVVALQTAPGDCAVVYAATSCVELSPAVSISSDGGATWKDASAGLHGATISSFVLDPHDSSLLYAVSSVGLFRTRLGSTRWSAVWLPGFPEAIVLTSVAFDPINSSILYASLDDTVLGTQGGIYKSTNGGRTWARAAGNWQQTAASSGAFNLVFDSLAPETLYALSGCCAFRAFKTTDGARTWTPLANPNPGNGIGSLATAASGVYVTIGSSIAQAGEGPSILVSRDQGTSWQPVAGNGPADYLLGVVAAPGGSPLFATGLLGLWRSTDGDHWRAAALGLIAEQIQAVASAADGTLYVKLANGLARTATHGRSWQVVTRSGGDHLTLDPQQAGTIYAFPPLAYLGLERSVDRGLTWQSFNFSGNDESVVIDPSASARLYAIGEARGNDPSCYVFKSLDAGGTWSCIDPGGGLDGLLVDPQHPQTLYGNIGSVVERSDDGGASWTRVVRGLPQFTSAIAVDPSQPERLYAAGFDGGMYRTLNQGESWQLLSPSLPAGANRILVDPRAPKRLYAGVPGQGIFASFDAGLTWNLLGKGLPGAQFSGAFDLDRLLPATLYAGTNGAGVFRLDLPLGAGATD